MKVFNKILKTILMIIMFIVLSYNIYNVINVRILKNDLTSVGGYALLEVVSGSMNPTIKVGDLIIIDTKTKNYNKNDIVTFYDVNSSFVTHRIVEIDKEKNMMTTKGDNNDSKDEPISMNNLVGKLKYKIPFLGMLIASLKNPVTLIVILIIGVLISYISSIDEEDTKTKKGTKKKSTTAKKTTSKKTVTKKAEVPKKTTRTKKVAEEKATTRKTATKKAETPKKTTGTKKAEAPKKTTRTKKVIEEKSATKKNAAKKEETPKKTTRTKKVAEEKSATKKTTSKKVETPKKATRKNSKSK